MKKSLSILLEGCPIRWNQVGYTSMPMKTNFLKSAVLAADYPDLKRPEIAIAGRSNTGKSSFINQLTKSKIAKVSQEPGKTRLLNFFDIGDYYRLVDTPGYGFASRSGDEILQWREMLETYLSTRQNLIGMLLLMDIRRDWSDDEQMLLDFMNSAGLPTMVLLTKSDRLKKPEIDSRKKNLINASGASQIWPISSQENLGIEEVEDFFFKNWIKPLNLKKGAKMDFSKNMENKK